MSKDIYSPYKGIHQQMYVATQRPKNTESTQILTKTRGRCPKVSAQNNIKLQILKS